MAVPIWNNNSKSYLVNSKTDPKDPIEVEVGNPNNPNEFEPAFKAKRWGLESVAFRMRYDWIPGAKITNNEENGTITWSKKVGQNVWQIKFYEDWGTPEGAYKFCEIYLPARPPQDYIEFDYDPEYADAFYQPPLTQAEKDEGASRPEEMEGGYVFYSTEHGGMNRADGPEYKVGKIGQLPRAKLIDANGNETWGTYNDDLATTNILRISVDPTWLDNAVYPVVVDPEFGYTSVGATTNGYYQDYMRGCKYTTSEDGTVTSISKHHPTHLYDDGPIEYGLYEADGGGTDTHTYIGNTDANSSPTPDTWVTLDITEGSGSVSGSTDYLLVMWGEEQSYNYDVGGGSYYTYSNSYPGSWPSPNYTDSESGTNRFSIYATYTASGGGGGETPDTTKMTTSKFWGG